MSNIVAWKCDVDGKIFEHKAKYVSHLRKLARERLVTRAIDKVNAGRDAFQIRMGNTVTSIDELEQFIRDNWEWFFNNGVANHNRSAATKHKLIDLVISVAWSNNVSNSHRCPRGGVVNWSQRSAVPGTPTGYPGWSGHIKYKIDAGHSTHKKPRPYSGFGSEYFTGTIINTGGGGSGDGISYDYGIELFASDFPAMLQARERRQVWNKISNQEVEFA